MTSASNSTSKATDHGLLDTDLALIIAAARSFPEISQVILFGSRAKATHKRGSDVDLAIKGNDVVYDTAVRLSAVLNEENPLPYYFDVLDYSGITEPALLEHIDRVGMVIYDREAERDKMAGHNHDSRHTL